MSRRSKLKRIKKLRAFRDLMLRKEGAYEMQQAIIRLDGVRRIDIDSHYSVSVNVNMEDNQHFFTKAFLEKDALCEVGLKIYHYLINQLYPQCVRII